MIKANLSLAGGGARGLTYLGSLKYFEENKNKIWIKQITGTSIGSIIASSWACGLNHKKIINIIKGIGLETLFYLHKGNIFKKIYALIDSRKFISSRILTILRDNLSWDNIKIPLCICASNLNTNTPEYFCSFDKTKKLTLSESVYESMNIPFVFKDFKTRIDKTSYCFIDGGFTDNSCSGPLSDDDYNILISWNAEKTIDLTLNIYKKLNVITKYIAILETMFMNGIYNGSNKYDDYIDTGYATEYLLDFRNDIIDKSVEIGYLKTKKYFENKNYEKD